CFLRQRQRITHHLLRGFGRDVARRFQGKRFAVLVCATANDGQGGIAVTSHGPKRFMRFWVVVIHQCRRHHIHPIAECHSFFLHRHGNCSRVFTLVFLFVRQFVSEL